MQKRFGLLLGATCIPLFMSQMVWGVNAPKGGEPDSVDGNPPLPVVANPSEGIETSSQPPVTEGAEQNDQENHSIKAPSLVLENTELATTGIHGISLSSEGSPSAEEHVGSGSPQPEKYTHLLSVDVEIPPFSPKVEKKDQS